MQIYKLKHKNIKNIFFQYVKNDMAVVNDFGNTKKLNPQDELHQDGATNGSHDSELHNSFAVFVCSVFSHSFTISFIRDNLLDIRQHTSFRHFVGCSSQRGSGSIQTHSQTETS